MKVKGVLSVLEGDGISKRPNLRDVIYNNSLGLKKHKEEQVDLSMVAQMAEQVAVRILPGSNDTASLSMLESWVLDCTPGSCYH